ncbi:MAG: hypothetical protein QOE58_725 [Actinomycetota bacterium]|jgi:hypothetical protein|nr:hypothetical protein [Actinomycetota bacterium]
MSNVTKVPSPALADRLAAVTKDGSELLTPLMAFAAEALSALRDFDAEVDAAVLDEEQLQEAAAPLGALHEVVFTIFQTAHEFLGMLFPVDESAQQPEAA